jgi:hypothetical protein
LANLTAENTQPDVNIHGFTVHGDSCTRIIINYNLLSTAPGSPKPEDLTPAWTFVGAWSPEANLPSVLPMAFLPKPGNYKTGIALAPKLTWVSGRSAKSHKIYFGIYKS